LTYFCLLLPAGWICKGLGARQAIAALIVVLSATNGVAFRKLPAHGMVADKSISTTVDSPLAKYYLENSLSSSGTNSELDKRITDVEQRAGPIDWVTLRVLSRETSPDFATLFFIKRTLAEHPNFQTAYSRELSAIRSAVRRSTRVRPVRNELRQYEFLFIPGFHYLSDPSSGADFYSQRHWFHQLGLRNRLVATQEDGTIEENAATIVESIRAERRSSTPLILVSTSKGGPEVALALGKLLEPDETATVKAWVSVGGLIHGTFLADSVMGWPKLWLAKMAFSHAGVDPRSLPGMTTTASRKRMEQIRFPHHILVVQVIGAPLSGDIGDDVKDRYTKLRKYGPNDGLTLLADEVLPGGITVIEPGLDHFYRDPEIDLKFLALADVVGGIAAYSP
jgi:hypothetical protein